MYTTTKIVTVLYLITLLLWNLGNSLMRISLIMSGSATMRNGWRNKNILTEKKNWHSCNAPRTSLNHSITKNLRCANDKLEAKQRSQDVAYSLHASLRKIFSATGFKSIPPTAVQMVNGELSEKSARIQGSLMTVLD